MFLFKVIKKLIYYFFSFLELFFLSKLVQLLLLFIFFISTFPLCLIRGNDRRRIFFGTDPIINNILWSKSLKDKIDRSDSVVHFHDDSFIAKAKDYDYIIEFYFFKFPKTYNQKILSLYAILNSIIIYYKYDFFWISFNGGPLNKTILGRFEILWLKFCKKKVILFPFGSDSYIYSELNDKTLQHALLSSQHHHLDDQNKIKKNKKLFFKYLDFYPASFQDNDSYIPKWSFVRPCFFCTNINKFKPSHKPKKDLVTIGHAPNHRGFKGTYFIQKAINELMDEGYKIEFLLIEGMEQDDLAKVFSEKVDILVDQIIFNGIAMCAIEGMSSGIPVIANLEETDTVLFFKRFSFLNECPIFSANIENIKDKIRELLDDENKRSTLGKLGREYVEKYHSPEAVSSDILKIIDSLQNNESLLNYYID